MTTTTQSDDQILLNMLKYAERKRWSVIPHGSDSWAVHCGAGLAFTSISIRGALEKAVAEATAREMMGESRVRY